MRYQFLPQTLKPCYTRHKHEWEQKGKIASGQGTNLTESGGPA